MTAAARGRANRAKGAGAERGLANWLKPWYPDACRAIRNTHPDPGDIACTSPGLWWSVKNTQVEQVNAWMKELRLKKEGRLGLLVLRRKGHASPGEWWCLMELADLEHLLRPDRRSWDHGDSYVRLEVRDLMPLLVKKNYARKPG